MTPTDRAALELCIATARRDPAYARQIDDRLKELVDWVEIAKAASFRCQREALDLMPWQNVPAYADAGPTRRFDKGSVELLRRMLALGISRWHPDPANECDRVEAERAEQAGRNANADQPERRRTRHHPVRRAAARAAGPQ
jgi:hypothetical protein